MLQRKRKSAIYCPEDVGKAPTPETPSMNVKKKQNTS